MRTITQKIGKAAFVLTISFVVIGFLVLIQSAGAVDTNDSNNQTLQGERIDDIQDYVEGEVLVRFKKGINKTKAKNMINGLGLEIKGHFKAISKITGYTHLHLKSKTKTTKSIIKDLSGFKDVVNISPNYRRYIASTTPNDTLFNSLWGLHNTGSPGGPADIDIDAPEIWDKTRGSSDILIAVIDTGIDYNHPDLNSNMWVNPGEIAGNSTDDDGNGYIDDVYGINAISGTGDPMDDHGHGTHCAGTIGAVGNNSQGTVGVNWDVGMIAAKFVNASGEGTDSDAIECIDYIVDLKTTYGQNIVAINAAWGSNTFNSSLKSAIDAAGTAGIVFCAAAGNQYNDNDTTPYYPASYNSTNIISVTAIDYAGNQHYNYGATSVDLAAPGRGIVSTTRAEYTPASGDLFHDDMESGDGKWFHGGVGDQWAITNAAAGGLEGFWWDMSYGNFWSDSPAAYYGDNISPGLVILGKIDLSSYVGHTLYLGFDGGFSLDFFVAGDTAKVVISKDGGTNWDTLADLSILYYTWAYYYLKQMYIIPDSHKTANFKFGFQITTDNTTLGLTPRRDLGWIIDNVGIGDNISYDYGYMHGSSMSTAFVTGAVALISEAYPAETVSQKISRILNNTVAMASLSGRCVTGGLLNINDALSTIFLTLTSPNGGESWQIGTTQNITWSYSGINSSIKLTLWKDGIQLGVIAVIPDPSVGSYAWTVGNYDGGPATAGTGYSIRVKKIGYQLLDNSDATFSLTN
jgi:subtilisin family serine protease